jgi:hypothetical protein
MTGRLSPRRSRTRTRQMSNVVCLDRRRRNSNSNNNEGVVSAGRPALLSAAELPSHRTASHQSTTTARSTFGQREIVRFDWESPRRPVPPKDTFGGTFLDSRSSEGISRPDSHKKDTNRRCDRKGLATDYARASPLFHALRYSMSARPRLKFRLRAIHPSSSLIPPTPPRPPRRGRPRSRPRSRAASAATPAGP